MLFPLVLTDISQMQGPSERLGSTITADKWPAKTDVPKAEPSSELPTLDARWACRATRPPSLGAERPLPAVQWLTSVDKSHRPKSERMAGMGGEETFFVIRPVDPSKMVPKLDGV
jgi:hypothetical protein